MHQEPSGWSWILHTLSPLDWFLTLVVAVSAISAFLRGFVRSLLSLVGLLVALYTASLYTGRVAATLRSFVGSTAAARVVAFALILLGVYAAIALLGRLLRGAFRAAGLGFVDRLAGAAFGAARGVVLLAAVALPLAPYLQHSEGPQNSVLLPYLLQAAHGIFFVVPRDLADRLPLGNWLAGWEAYTRRSSARHAKPDLR